MKKLLLILAVLVAVVLLNKEENKPSKTQLTQSKTQTSPEPVPKKKITKTTPEPDQSEQVVAYFKSGEEKQVKDALWATSKILKLGVLDDGSRRDGYAQYGCQVLYEHGFKGQSKVVQIIDIAKLVQTKEWVELGLAYCS